MISQPRPLDLDSPLPTRQFRAFLLFFHTLILSGIGFTLYAHWNRSPGPPQQQTLILTGLVALHLVLYIAFFAIPSVIGRLNFTRWWWLSFIASVVLILAETRIDPRFSWATIAYVSQISVFPLRISVPVAGAMLAGLIFTSRANFITIAFQFGAWFVLAFFLGRLTLTSVERGQLILELEKTKFELEKARQADAELAVLRERERFARDLHDNLGHSLVTLTVQLEAAQRLQSSDPVRAAALLEEMQKLTRASMGDLRRSLTNLRAPGLGDRPLTQAVQTLCTDASKRCAIPVDCDLTTSADSLPSAVAEALWRLVQESLTNIEKHARARKVQVHISLRPREAVLRVQDDGVGLPSDAEEKPGHFGLRGLRERVEGLGGTLSLDSNGHGGTLLEARLPLIA